MKRKLGTVGFVDVGNNTIVANMIAQHDIRPDSKGNPPIRYQSLRKCLKVVNFKAKELNATVHMPKIDAGLAGGDWDKIAGIIQEELVDCDVIVYILK